ncbi:Holliday junction branch migration protein RuvA [Cyanobium sp. NIES-981]|uniref:Holliday junction branch migration protein RuvA n=1 Tax=Cyanobium sp. NIES-981 TaxID=1851505 RepID=UPI0007DD3C8E|nr:Holliday junction branch migration protein RuvA [Cyanobium sp. NIES-981]SBO42398.1 Holliday junction ATP-dependent DNA helicase RuvA [Cyanobium sp. NIES-981]
MIGWLQGELADPWQHDKRCGLMLLCQGVGYEVQVSQREWQRLPPPGAALGLHIHQSIREDAWTLYGFTARQERDLFRELVAVSGVGPQMALGLLGALEPEELVQAIVQPDLRRLCHAPGVGKRTAERLAVELRGRLQERYLGPAGPGADSGDGSLSSLADGSRDDIHGTLVSLGFAELEIHRALHAVAAQGLDPEASTEDWIRDCLRWLSRSAA